MKTLKHCWLQGVCLPVSLALLAMGCATTPKAMYEGPPRPDTETAHIETAKVSCFSGGTLYVSKVDAVRTTHWLSPLPGARAVDVLPGQHVLSLHYDWGSLLADGELPLDATAGQKYTINHMFRPGRVTMWIVDANGTVVSGEKPTGDN